MVNLIPVFALLLTVIVGIWVVITIVKRIESKVERIDSKVNASDDAILTTEAAVKWFLREKNMEVNHSFGHYNVQSVCLNCYRQRPECCIGCSARRVGRDITINREDVRWLASELESCTTRLVKEMHDTSKDSVDALALALNIKSGMKKK